MRMGVTGHRPNRLQIGEERVCIRLRQAMVTLRDAARQKYPARPLIAISPLAEGADRLFAALALELGYELQGLLPFPSVAYQTTFSDRSRTGQYHALLRRAASVTELGGSLADTQAAYEAVGRETVDRSDVLLAVWDGMPAGARGGTGDIITYALARRRPVIWVDARQDRKPQLLRRAAPRIDARVLRADRIAGLIG